MSGHNKWSKIKNQKGAADQARGQLFTKLGNSIALAVFEGGGGNPDFNMKLRFAIEKARGANMPNDNIKRAIDRALAKGKGAGGLESVVYEGFGPAGAALLIEGLTDNKQRTVSAVKNILNTHGGSLGGTGSVGYLFEKIGIITFPLGTMNEEAVLNLVVESGARDFEIEDGQVSLMCDADKLHEVAVHLESAKIPIQSRELVFRAISEIDVSQDSAKQIGTLIEALEALDDIQNVFTTAKFVSV